MTSPMKNMPVPYCQDKAAMRDELGRDGTVLFPGGLSRAAVLELQEILRQLFGMHQKPGEDLYETCQRLDREDKPLLYRIYQFVPKTAAMDAIRRECLPYVKALYPEGVPVDIGSGVLFGMPNDQRLIWNWHQESTYHPKIEKIVHFWFPVMERSDAANGTMTALRATHALGQLDFSKVKIENGSTSLIPQGVEELEQRYEHVIFEANPGDLAILDRNLIHRSNRNGSPRTRFTGVVRYAILESIPERVDFSQVEG